MRRGCEVHVQSERKRDIDGLCPIKKPLNLFKKKLRNYCEIAANMCEMLRLVESLICAHCRALQCTLCQHFVLTGFWNQHFWLQLHGRSASEAGDREEP